MSAPDVVAVNRAQRLFVTSEDKIGQITNWVGADGEETDEPDMAVSAVGKAGGLWFAIRLNCFETVSRH